MLKKINENVHYFLNCQVMYDLYKIKKIRVVYYQLTMKIIIKIIILLYHNNNNNNNNNNNDNDINQE